MGEGHTKDGQVPKPDENLDDVLLVPAIEALDPAEHAPMGNLVERLQARALQKKVQERVAASKRASPAATTPECIKCLAPPGGRIVRQLANPEANYVGDYEAYFETDLTEKVSTSRTQALLTVRSSLFQQSQIIIN